MSHRVDLAAEFDRLDRLHGIHWPRALAGDVEAAGLILDLMDQRARLLGLYQPPQAIVLLEPGPTPAAEPATRY